MYFKTDIDHTEIDGNFSGNQRTYSLGLGGYFMTNIIDDVTADGFISLGWNNNDLNISNETLTVKSNYDTQTLMLGGNLSGVAYQEWLSIRPTLSFNYAMMSIGNMDFTGKAYGLINNELTLLVSMMLP